MNKDRLLRLADLLEANANNPTGAKFDLGVWAAKDGYGSDLTFEEIKDFRIGEGVDVVPVDCGTVVCAVGLAAISGVFKDEGLGWKISASELVPTFEDHDGFDAVNEFFDLTYDQSEFLFSGHNYELNERKGKVGELAVTERIREFVNTEGANGPLIHNEDEDGFED